MKDNKNPRHFQL